MALKAGNRKASEGMSKVIYQEIKNLFLAHFIDIDIKEEDLNKIHEGWQRLSYAIAKGVIEHIIENMEIIKVQTKGNVNTTVEGTTKRSGGGHRHKVNLTGEELNVVFTQSNDGKGLVK